MPEPSATPELLLELYCYRVIADWINVDREVVATVQHRGCLCEIAIRPTGVPMIELPKLTECEADVLAALKASLPNRLTKPEIEAALETAGKIHGESTIRLALRRLSACNLVQAPGVGSHEGYLATLR